MNVLWGAAFLTGLLGSLHCVAMCGPLALALPTGKMSQPKAVYARVLYNLGRILTYSLMGGIFGVFGQTLFWVGFQQQVSVLAGIILLLIVVSTTQIGNLPPLNHLSQWIRQRFSFIFRQQTLSALFLLGILNGLLPCGLVYVALAGAVASATWHGGMVYMALFGIGTAPALFLVTLTAVKLPTFRRTLFQKYATFFSILIALLLILRGLNLDIPYVSPQFSESTSISNVTICH